MGLAGGGYLKNRRNRAGGMARREMEGDVGIPDPQNLSVRDDLVHGGNQGLPSGRTTSARLGRLHQFIIGIAREKLRAGESFKISRTSEMISVPMGKDDVLYLHRVETEAPHALYDVCFCFIGIIEGVEYDDACGSNQGPGCDLFRPEIIEIVEYFGGLKRCFGPSGGQPRLVFRSE